MALHSVTLPALQYGDGSGFMPPGATWQPDTIPGVDIYGKGFVQRPTIFYDPTATASRNLGTFQNPYSTVAQVQARCTGNMAGQVLGVKRGTQSAPLTLSSVYGSSSAPFFIVPYGGAAAMPVFTGETLRTGWASAQASPKVWSMAITNSPDLYERIAGTSYRLWAVTGASGAAVITALTSYAASPVAGTIGAFGYFSGTAYLYLVDGSDPTAANNIYSADSANAIKITYKDVSGTGNIVLVGMTGRMTYDSAISMVPVIANTGTNAAANLQVVGCQMRHVGSQVLWAGGGNYAMDGVLIAGISGATAAGVLVQGGYVGGNYAYDCLNNAVELNAATGLTVERNIGAQIGGNSVVECYALNTNHIVQFNRGYTDILTPSRLGTSAHQCGIWFNNFDGLGARDSTKNGGMTARFNYLQDANNYHIDNTGCTNNSFTNNTLVDYNARSNGVVFQGGSGSTGHSYTNNLSVCANGNSTVSKGFFRTQGAGTPTPTLDYNAWFNVQCVIPANGGGWTAAGTDYYTLSAWRTATGGEAHSISTISGVSIAQAGFAMARALSPVLGTNTDYTLTASAASGAGQSIAATGITLDIDGRAIANTAAPAMGAVQASA